MKSFQGERCRNEVSTSRGVGHYDGIWDGLNYGVYGVQGYVCARARAGRTPQQLDVHLPPMISQRVVSRLRKGVCSSMWHCGV